MNNKIGESKLKSQDLLRIFKELYKNDQLSTRINGQVILALEKIEKLNKDYDVSYDELINIFDSFNAVDSGRSIFEKLFCAINTMKIHMDISLENNSNTEKLFSLSYKNILRACKLIQDLASTNKLNQDSYNEVIRIANISLTKPSESTVTEKVSMWSKSSMWSMTTVDSNILLFTKDKMSGTEKSESGAYGQVKKSYHSVNSDDVLYAIKKYHNYPSCFDANKEVVHEAKYHQLLNNHPHFFKQNDRVMLMYDWKNGNALINLTQEQISSLSLHDRLVCFKSLLANLNQLHQSFRTHGDIKAANIILDINQLKMHLIDFNLSYKPLGDRQWSFGNQVADTYLRSRTHRSDNGQTKEYSFCDDMYALSFIGAKLFPELYQLNLDSHFSLTKKFSTNDLCAEQKSISLLIDAFYIGHNEYNPDIRKMRPTCKDSLSYCEKVLTQWGRLDEKTLNEILRSTIKREDVTVENVLHGHLSAMM